MVYHLPACKGEEVMHASRIVDIPSKKIIHAHSYYNMCVPAHVSCRDSKVAKGYVVFTAVFFSVCCFKLAGGCFVHLWSQLTRPSIAVASGVRTM